MRGNRRTSTTLLVLVTAVALTSLALGGTAIGAALQDGGDDAESLLSRLAAIENQLPALPPETVLVDPEQTWAEFTGDFTGARVAFDTIADEARALFVAGEQAQDPVALAVADVSRSLLVLRTAYQVLAEWETHDLAFPLDSFDSDDVATGADEVYGVAQTGLALVLEARESSLAAYDLLRGAAEADDGEKALFDQRYLAARSFQSDVRPLLHTAMSLPSLQVLTTISRFGTDAPGEVARARVMEIVCLDRATVDELDLSNIESLRTLEVDRSVDCPDLPAENTVSVSGG